MHDQIDIFAASGFITSSTQCLIDASAANRFQQTKHLSRKATVLVSRPTASLHSPDKETLVFQEQRGGEAGDRT